LLVIDEADLLLDMGFSETMTHIFEYLPSTETRQTFLFSATLSTNVHRLATISLKVTIVFFVFLTAKKKRSISERFYSNIPYECFLNKKITTYLLHNMFPFQ
jgi:superfamily II DNA/RNA helicase